jgi:hypothetical protein
MMTMLSRGRNRLKLVLRSLCLLVVSLGVCLTGEFPPKVRSSTSSRESTSQQQPEWPKYAFEGISYQVALSSVSGKLGKPGSRQTMFLFLEQNLFSEDRVLRIFRHIHFQVPQPTTLYVTILTDRASMRERLKKDNWESSLDDNYSRLTQQPQHCCPPAFQGAQLERYVSRSMILVCDNGKAKEIVLEH